MLVRVERLAPVGCAAPRCRMSERSYLYNDIVMQLRSRIARGIYRPGGRLPSLNELMSEFEVSAITVRRALRELEYQGAVEGQQGRGVFVKPKPKIHRVLAGDPSRSIGDEIERAGFTPRLIEVGCREVAADEYTAARLRVPLGMRLVQHQKLTFADEEPVALHTLHMRPALARTLRKQLAYFFIFHLLAERGIEIARLGCDFSSAPLGDEHARLFELPPGHAMLRVDYTAIGTNGAPFMLGQTICRADRFTFQVELPRAPAATVAKRARPIRQT
jgi:DNA-binding GntR family transcriptional regulator